MEERWVVVRKGADFEGIAKKYKVSPIIARLMRNREIIGDDAIDEYLNGTLDNLYDGILMKDMNVAVDIIREKIQSKKHIRIIGDYDIDGINATYILVEGLRKLGALVDSDIPDRIKDGYGLNIELIERAIADGIDTIITCDNGIAALHEIAYAKAHGLTIIITDHHEVPYEEVAGENGFERTYIYPNADAIIDPKQEYCGYPFKGLCGAGIAYKLVEVLFQVSGADSEDVDYLMENVAIATIGDVMDLIGENRIFVKQGLEMLKRTKNIGLKSLLEKTVPDISQLNSYHIGFVIGPCLNASGRLDTAKRALELFMTKNKAEAEVLATDLKALNDSRKEMTIQGVEEAKKQVEEQWLEDKILVIYLPDCHESLAGIIAGRIRELYHKPTFVLTKGEEGVKGSGRSIDAYHMFEEMSKCKELFTKFGGHKLAAGLSLPEENVEKFRRILNQLSTLSEEDLQAKIAIDMQLPICYVNPSMIEELSLLEPFGKGNHKPCFAERELEIVKLQVLGKMKNVLKVRLRDLAGDEIDGICFNNIELMLEDIIAKYGQESLNLLQKGRRSGVKLSLVYYPGINEFNGNTTLQLVIQNYKV
ncbi:MAG: single-stranded-DNA-specific exonuclease RecJ [Eubacteriales bacterium]